MLDSDLRDELSITERLRKLAAIPAGSPVVKGIGDDCAIYRPRGSADDLLFTSDLISEGVHFVPGSHTPAELGRKALTRSLSDIAAMGGAPRFALVALCVAPWADAKWVDRFFDGILGLAAESGTVLAGGDLSRGDRLLCDVTVCGAAPRGRALLRSGARAGNDIYVSGALGGSALGLATQKGKAWKRHKNPEARLGLGEMLREKLRATAAMDLSDGLSLDLRRICLASGVSAEIEEPPLYRGADLEQGLHGGEDYELVFTVRAGQRVPEVFENIALTRIGRIIRGTPGHVVLGGIALPARGYDHFRTP